MQTIIMSGNAEGKGGMLGAAADIMRRQGPIGFFRGFGISGRGSDHARRAVWPCGSRCVTCAGWRAI